MDADKQLRGKLQQQYNIAEQQRQLLVAELYRLIDDLENRPVIRQHSPFPYGALERAIESGLDRFEKKFLRRIWAYLRRRAQR
jgi:hypothetical protein